MPEYLKYDQDFHESTRRGPNGLFILLRMLGRDIKYQDVMDVCALNDQGASLTDLENAAAALGAIATPRKHVSPADLRDARMPVLVHISTPGVSGESRSGHYIAITRIVPREGDDSRFVAFGFDTTNLQRFMYTDSFLARNMSGYIMLVGVPEQTGLPLSTTILWSVNGILLLTAIGIRIRPVACANRPSQAA